MLSIFELSFLTKLKTICHFLKLLLKKNQWVLQQSFKNYDDILLIFVTKIVHKGVLYFYITAGLEENKPFFVHEESCSGWILWTTTKLLANLKNLASY